MNVACFGARFTFISMMRAQIVKANMEPKMGERTRHKQSSSVFVILAKNERICMLRRKATGWMDGSLSIPAGGLDAGETIRSAAIREAYEEVGVRIAPENLQYVHTLHSTTNDQTWIGHFFQTTIWEGDPILRERDKHEDVQWQPLTALPSETIPYIRQALSCIARQQNYSEYGWDYQTKNPHDQPFHKCANHMHDDN